MHFYAVEKGDKSLVDVNSDHFFCLGNDPESKISGSGADIGHGFVFQVAKQGNNHVWFLPDAPVLIFVIGDQAFKISLAAGRNRYLLGNIGGAGWSFPNE